MIGVIPNIVFVILIALATGYLTFLTTKGGLTDNRFSNAWEKLTNRGRLVLLTLLLILILLGLQEWNSQSKNDKRDLVLERERIQRDSTITNGIKSGVDSNRKILFNDLSEALAKQNLRLDTVTKNIQSLRDSAKTIILNSPKASPVIIVRDEGVNFLQKEDTLELTISLVSSQASCNLYSLKYFLEVNFTDGSKAVSRTEKIITGLLIMPKDEVLSKTLEFYSLKKLSYVNIALIGSYTSTENSKEIKLRDVYQYRTNTKKTGFLQAEQKENFLNRYNIN